MRRSHAPFILSFLTLSLGLAPLPAAEINVAPPTSEFSITSTVVEGTNLLLTIGIPAGLQRIILETRPALDAPWEEAGLLDVPRGTGEATFSISKPTVPTTFFRLKATLGTLAGPKARQNLATTPLISSELQYATMPSLASKLEKNGDAIFHFKGRVDGSDKILITHDGTLWTHVSWAWPHLAVTINGTKWNAQEKNYLTVVPGGPKFLPETLSLDFVSLEVIHGRDLVALERTNQGLIVYIDDTPKGSDLYDFKIHFHPAPPAPAAITPSTVAQLKIAAHIDGSDRIKITLAGATLEHKSWGYPDGIRLNNILWYPDTVDILKNEGANTFLPAGVDLSTARIIGRKGRDVSTLWAEKDAVWVWFADNPNGGDAYQLEIQFGPK